jgi:hypothetical protein
MRGYGGECWGPPLVNELQPLALWRDNDSAAGLLSAALLGSAHLPPFMFCLRGSLLLTQGGCCIVMPCTYATHMLFVCVSCPAQAVILATGGFGASKELLQRYSPLAASLATTNGPWAQVGGWLYLHCVPVKFSAVPSCIQPGVALPVPAGIQGKGLNSLVTPAAPVTHLHTPQGEGLEIASKAGAHLVDLQEVQIHPTGTWVLLTYCLAILQLYVFMWRTAVLYSMPHGSRPSVRYMPGGNQVLQPRS